MNTATYTLKVSYTIEEVRKVMGSFRNHILFRIETVGQENTITFRCGQLSPAMNYWYGLIHSTAKGRENQYRFCLREEGSSTIIEVHSVEGIQTPESLDNMDKVISTIGSHLDGSWDDPIDIYV